jgi:hypothetical protein
MFSHSLLKSALFSVKQCTWSLAMMFAVRRCAGSSMAISPKQSPGVSVPCSVSPFSVEFVVIF